MLEYVFELRARSVTVGTEVLAGVTTFMVMAYIIFVNPAILSFTGIPGLEGQGPGFAPTLAATCLVAGVMTALMGLVTNYPLAMASGMGLNAVIAFQLVVGLKLPWPTAMGVITLEGIIITILVLTGFRTAVVDAIPLGLKRAIGVGIGLFILFIGLYSGGLVKQGTGIPVTLGDLTSPSTLVAVVGVACTTAGAALPGRTPHRHCPHHRGGHYGECADGWAGLPDPGHGRDPLAPRRPAGLFDHGGWLELRGVHPGGGGHGGHDHLRHHAVRLFRYHGDGHWCWRRGGLAG